MIIESITILGLNCQNCQETHEYVDLGLPRGTLWATENIKNRNGEDLYFAWGETSGYTAEQVGADKNFTWADYQWGNPNSGTLVTDALIDENNNLKPEYDAATANWGEGWRMPTIRDFGELCNDDNTESTWTQVNGVSGIMFTSRHNGNTLFFPIDGHVVDGHIYYGDISGYWRASLCDEFDYSIGSKIDFIYGDIPTDSCGYRCQGFPIRPVRSNS